MQLAPHQSRERSAPVAAYSGQRQRWLALGCAVLLCLGALGLVIGLAQPVTTQTSRFWLQGTTAGMGLLAVGLLWLLLAPLKQFVMTEPSHWLLGTKQLGARTTGNELPEQAPIIRYRAALDDVRSMLYVSPQIRLLGFSVEEWLGEPTRFWQQVHPDDRAQLAAQQRVFAANKPITGLEYRIYTRTGQLLWVRDEADLICDEWGQPRYLQGVLLDITSHKESAEALLDSAARIRLIADNVPALIAYVDHQQIYQFVNKGFEEWYQTSNIIGCHLREVAGDQSYVGIQGYVEAALSGIPMSFEYSRVYPDGILRYVAISYIPHFGPDKQVLGFFTLVQDLTERKQAEQRVRASLEEKEVLLKEIHHRVKNNLQVISSLLYLQSERVADEKMRVILHDCQNRVKSMALIHEKLYLAQDLARVDAAEYIRNLAGYLVRSYAAQSGGVQLAVQADNIFLGIDTATTCGLILNELISNALKHAFPNGRTGQIRVALTAAPEGKFTLLVGDDGVGAPANFDFRQAHSLGMQLVNTLVRQLDGAIELHRNGGVTFKIQFSSAE